MVDISEISGTLSRKDLRNLTRAMRSGTVGPTTVYYAGVTAPIISAGVAVFSRNLMAEAGFISLYWLWLISAFIAAFAGISWYLIFMRWSYRSTHGRGEEMTTTTALSITDDALVMTRDHVTTLIEWAAITKVETRAKFIAVTVQGHNPVLIPNHWFQTDNDRRKAFHDLLKARAQL